MKTVPRFMQGVHRIAMRQALEAAIVGEERGDVLLQTRGWKLFFLIRRMFLFRPSRGVQVPRETSMTRLDFFQRGQWIELVEMSVNSSVTGRLDVGGGQWQRRRET